MTCATSLPDCMTPINGDSFSLEPGQSHRSNAFEDGLRRQSPRTTHPIRLINVSYLICSCDDKEKVEEWLFCDLNNTTDYFNWPDPCNGRIKRARIFDNDYSISSINTGMSAFRMDATLEIWG